MVRNYIKKGGHGGRREGAGLRAGHWEEQGGRAAAGIAKAEHKAKAAHDKTAAKARWAGFVGTSKNVQTAQLEQPADVSCSPRKAAMTCSSSESPAPAAAARAAAAAASCSSEHEQ